MTTYKSGPLKGMRVPVKKVTIQIPEPLHQRLWEVFWAHGGPNNAFDNRRTFNKFLVEFLEVSEKKERRRLQRLERKARKELEEAREAQEI